MIRLDFVEERQPFCTLEILIPVRFRMIVLHAVDECRDLTLLKTSGVVLLLREDHSDVLLHFFTAERGYEPAERLGCHGLLVFVAHVLHLGEEGVVLDAVGEDA